MTELSDDILNLALSEFYDKSPRNTFSESSRVAMRKAIETALRAAPRCEVRTDELLAELRHHERDYPELVHGPLCGQAADEIERLRTAAQAGQVPVPNYEFPYQATFDAIIAATNILGERSMGISVRKFQEAFNSHRDKRPISSVPSAQGNTP